MCPRSERSRIASRRDISAIFLWQGALIAALGSLIGCICGALMVIGVSHIPLMDRYRNVAVFRTLSKFAGLAGMRVGYGLFPRVLVPFLHHVTPPFHNISVASSVAAIASLEDLDYLRENVARIIADHNAYHIGELGILRQVMGAWGKQ